MIGYVNLSGASSLKIYFKKNSKTLDEHCCWILYPPFLYSLVQSLWIIRLGDLNSNFNVKTTLSYPMEICKDAWPIQAKNLNVSKKLFLHFYTWYIYLNVINVFEAMLDLRTKSSHIDKLKPHCKYIKTSFLNSGYFVIYWHFLKFSFFQGTKAKSQANGV